MGVESEQRDRIGVGAQAGEGGRIGIAEEVAGQKHEGPHQRRVAVAAEGGRWGGGADDPDARLAAVYPVRLGTQALIKRRSGPGALDDGGKPFLRILDELQPFDQVLLAR